MKSISQLIFIGIILVYSISLVSGHGMLLDPVNRGSAWRKGFNVPTNFNDNGNYCGGYFVYHNLNHGRCGLCGDDFSLPQPRPNENGGIYGTGQIVATYIVGQEFVADVLITANHRGYLKFDICPLESPQDIETEECFEQYPIKTVDGDDRYFIDESRTGHYYVPLALPENLTCDHCSLRWTYVAANNWGTCPDQTEGLGCGLQETFKTCSDIKIIQY